MNKQLNITLHTIQTSVTECTSLVKHGDSLELILRVLDGENKVLNLEGKTVKLILKKSDSTILEETLTNIKDVTISTKSTKISSYVGSEITATLDIQATIATGVVKGEILIIDDSGSITTNTFTLLVVPTLSDSIVEESQDQIQTFAELYTALNKYIDLSIEIGGDVEAIQSLAEVKYYIDNNLPLLQAENDEAVINNTNLQNGIAEYQTIKTALDEKVLEANTFVNTHGDIIDLDNRMDSAESSIIQINADLSEKANQTDLDSTNNNVLNNTNAIALKASTAYVDTKVAGAVSGAPKAVSLVANMTDITKKYVYTGTESGYIAGNWYYWNGTAWTSGGTYQGTAIAESSITPAMLQYKGLTKNKGDVFPFKVIVRGDNTNTPNDVIKNLFLDIKLYNPDRTKLYKITWIGNNALVSSAYYTGIKLQSFNKDWTGVTTLISHSTSQNTGVGALTGIQTLRYLFGESILEVTIDFDALASGSQISMDGTAHPGYRCVIDETCLYEYTPPVEIEEQKIGLMSAYKSGNLLRVATKYDSNNDLILTFTPKGLNSIYSFSYMNTIANTDKKVTQAITTLDSTTQLINVYSDWIGPYVVEVTANADGDNQTVAFTGGFHAYNGDQSGVATARTVTKEIYIDGAVPTEDTVIDCQEVVLKVTNNIQSYMTKKSDGTGREVLQEVITYTIKPHGIVEVKAEIQALEGIKIVSYMGLQLQTATSWNGQVFFDDDVNIKWLDCNGVSVEAGNKTNSDCRKFTVKKDNNAIEVWMNDTGLGKRKYIADTTRLAYTETYNKAYFNLVRESTGVTLNASDMVKWSGGYRFFGNNI